MITTIIGDQKLTVSADWGFLAGFLGYDVDSVLVVLAAFSQWPGLAILDRFESGGTGSPLTVCYSARTMSFRRRFGLYDSTLKSWQRLWNLLVKSIGYLAAVVVLGLLVGLSGRAMGWIGDLVGVDEKTQVLMAWAMRSIFVVLIMVGLTHAFGDAAKLVWYYVRDWRNDDEQPGAGREDEGT